MYDFWPSSLIAAKGLFALTDRMYKGATTLHLYNHHPASFPFLTPHSSLLNSQAFNLCLFTDNKTTSTEAIMVAFRNIITATLALAAPIAAAITPAQVVDNIRMLTTKSQALQGPANSISIINGPLIIIGQGPFPQIIAGFVDIVSTATTAIAQMQGMPDVPAGKETDACFEAFREFVRVHQVLLNILIGKAGLFQTVPFIGAPVASVLRQVESVVDTIAFMLIDTFERKADFQAQGNSLSETITTCINKFEGIQISKRSIAFPRRAIAEAAVVGAAA
ncbi:uvi-1 [Pyrenophora seminiperda CCB06]|uniref:Uvi-1 n=1 Tax=Pyrenophora seminiperda CCB06 TaxID=1302712 RepID=A0A3M7LYR5_9PLEO|nr:uvi-1 [Pyrenophora seminiperda CCB06]